MGACGPANRHHAPPQDRHRRRPRRGRRDLHARARRRVRAGVRHLSRRRPRPGVPRHAAVRPDGASAVTAGLLATGCEVVDLGICPTPTLQLAVPWLGARGGIAISAGHNPAPWNALKFVRGDGLYLNVAQADELLDLYHQGEFTKARWDRVPSAVAERDAIDHHVDVLSRHVDTDAIRARRPTRRPRLLQRRLRPLLTPRWLDAPRRERPRHQRRRERCRSRTRPNRAAHDCRPGRRHRRAPGAPTWASSTMRTASGWRSWTRPGAAPCRRSSRSPSPLHRAATRASGPSSPTSRRRRRSTGWPRASAPRWCARPWASRSSRRPIVSAHAVIGGEGNGARRGAGVHADPRRAPRASA